MDRCKDELFAKTLMRASDNDIVTRTYERNKTFVKPNST